MKRHFTVGMPDNWDDIWGETKEHSFEECPYGAQIPGGYIPCAECFKKIPPTGTVIDYPGIGKDVSIN